MSLHPIKDRARQEIRILSQLHFAKTVRTKAVLGFLMKNHYVLLLFLH